MDIWRIIPQQSVGPLPLDASVQELESMLGTEYDRFTRGANPNPILAFDKQGLQIEIGNGDKPLAITVFPPTSVALNDIELTGRDTALVEKELRDCGMTFERVDAGLWSGDLLIMLVEQEGRIDGVEVRRVPY